MIDHLWQSTVFAVVAGLLAAALRQNRAHVRYWLWFAASLKFFVPFSLLMRLGRQLEWTSVVNAPAAPAVSRALEHIAQPFSDVFPTTPATAQTTWASFVILIVWLCGFAAITLTRWRGWQRIRAAVRTSAPLRLPDLDIQVRSSPGLLEPGIVGLWRPVLLVPAGIEECLTAPQLKAVLAHELCHVRRRDNLTASIHMMVEAVFWFHPLVWWIGARLVEERERACDEHVLRAFGEPQAYAEAILNVCKLYVESPLACVSGVSGSHVKKRIEEIMVNRIGLRLNVAKKAVLALAATSALTAPIVMGMMTAPAIAQSAPAKASAEAALREDLFQMRKAIDQYYADKKRYPRRLASLTSEGYLKKIPTDPFTNRTDSWQTVLSKPDPSNPTASRGIFDVKSGAKATARDGTKYSDW